MHSVVPGLFWLTPSETAVAEPGAPRPSKKKTKNYKKNSENIISTTKVGKTEELMWPTEMV